MYRSKGEFSEYASETFRLFAAKTLPVAGVVADGVLDLEGLRAAFFVLFGEEPSSTLFSVLAQRESTPDEGEARPSSPKWRFSVDKTTFVRFMLACTAERSDGSVDLALSVDPSAATAGGPGPSAGEVGGRWDPLSWRLFKALAGPDGAVTLEGLLEADRATPFQALDPAPVAATTVSSEEAQRRRQALVTHTFRLLDVEQRGKLSYAELQPYLHAA